MLVAKKIQIIYTPAKLFIWSSLPEWDRIFQWFYWRCPGRVAWRTCVHSSCSSSCSSTQSLWSCGWRHYSWSVSPRGRIGLPPSLPWRHRSSWQLAVRGRSIWDRAVSTRWFPRWTTTQTGPWCLHIGQHGCAYHYDMYGRIIEGGTKGINDNVGQCMP